MYGSLPKHETLSASTINICITNGDQQTAFISFRSRLKVLKSKCLQGFKGSSINDYMYLGKVGNIEYGNVDFEKAKFETVTSTAI